MERFFNRNKYDEVSEGIPQVVHLKVKCELFGVTEDTHYQDILQKLKEHGYRGATLGELWGWDKWDGESEVIAPGTLIKFQGEEYCPVVCLDQYCTPGKCFSKCRLAKINTKWPWRPPFCVLAVKLDKIN